MKLNETWYGILKWLVVIVIPALTTAYVGLSAVWGWPYAEPIAKTSAIICTLLGAILGISTAEYYREPPDEEWEEEEEEEEPAEHEDNG